MYPFKAFYAQKKEYLLISGMAWHNETGKKGERMAAGYLEQKGFTLIDLNWRYKRLEVDIIASKDDVLHFVEVKSTHSKNGGNPEEKVGKKKFRNLLQASDEYLHQHPEWKKIQFDILSITMFDETGAVEYFMLEDVYDWD